MTTMTTTKLSPQGVGGATAQAQGSTLTSLGSLTGSLLVAGASGGSGGGLAHAPTAYWAAAGGAPYNTGHNSSTVGSTSISSIDYQEMTAAVAAYREERKAVEIRARFPAVQSAYEDYLVALKLAEVEEIQNKP